MAGTWPRKQTSTAPTPGSSRPNGPTVYFLADEKTVQASEEPNSSSDLRHDSPRDSTYGVRSLNEPYTDAHDTQELDSPGGHVKQIIEDTRKHQQRPAVSSAVLKAGSRVLDVDAAQDPARTSQIDAHPVSSDSPSSASIDRLQSETTISRPLSPLCTVSPHRGLSEPLSPQSLSLKSSRFSESGSAMDDNTSQALGSSDDDYAVTSEVHDSIPQLIMPSINMPSRRQFTERGKQMGRLKVLVAGESGSGKTSLIKSIVQTCVDIVHVDPLTLESPNLVSQTRNRSRAPKRQIRQSATSHIVEVYASTRPYPSWWTDIDDTKVLRRRKSLGDTVLERNLCFVDTPGHGEQTVPTDYVESLMTYLETQSRRSLSLGSLAGRDLSGMLSGNGGTQVDVAFYLLTASPKPIDISAIHHLSTLTNVIPLVAKADSLTSERLFALKTKLLAALEAANIRPFLFGKTHQEALNNPNSLPPFGVSSATSNEAETMDASLLMSPDYVLPLISSDLATLVEKVFQQDSIAWLRHSAAKKIVTWRAGRLLDTSNSIGISPSQVESMNPLHLGGRSGFPLAPSTRSLTSSQVLVSPHAAATSYALARVSDHTQREDRVAQLRLAKWAKDLQRSLRNERERFEALARGEQAIWLTEKLGQCVLDGTIVPASTASASNNTLARPLRDYLSPSFATNVAITRGTGATAGVNAQDPLGLLHLKAKLMRNSWLVVQIVGSFGIAGGLAVWLAKTWGVRDETLLPSNWTWWNRAD